MSDTSISIIFLSLCLSHYKSKHALLSTCIHLESFFITINSRNIQKNNNQMELMNDGDHHRASELLKAQAHIWNHMFSFINSMSLNCAIQLEIPDVIHNHGGPMTLSELVEALPINKAKAPCIYSLMRILVHSGFFLKLNIPNNDQKEEEEAYLLTPSSRLLLKDEPFSVRPLYIIMLDPIFVKPWHFLSKWFKNDDSTSFETAHGRSVYAGNDPEFNQLFNNGMASDARFITSVVIKECKGVFKGINSLVDVGGGTGAVARAITDAFPHLSCTVLDLPHVVANMEGSGNLSYVGGDMFEVIPHADAVFLKWILPDWEDEECLKILKKCKEAIPSKEKGGKVIIIDMVVDIQEGDYYRASETKLFFDMLVMVNVGGRQRTKKDWEELFKSAGFSDYKITPVLGLRSLIEVFP